MDFVDSIPELKDNARRGFLYSEFKELEEDALSFDSKMDFWLNAVSKAAETFNWFSVTEEQILSSFTKEGLKPECIGVVLAEMKKRKLAQPLEDFLSEQGWGGWLIDNFLKKSLFSWSDSNKLDAKYVLVIRIQKTAEKLIENYKNHSLLETKILAMDDLKLTKDDLNLLETFLQRSKSGVVFNVTEGGEKAIKFGSTDVTETDIGTTRMRLTLKTLKEQKIKLEEDIEKCTKQAVFYHTQKKQKKEALVYLKRRKRLQDILLKRLQSTDTIKEILERIDDAHTNKAILDAYRLGTNTLKETTKQSGLSAEAVDEVMVELDEAFANQREIDEALKVGPQEMVFDEEELESELGKIMEEGEEKNVQDMLSKLKIESSSPIKTAPATKQQRETELAM